MTRDAKMVITGIVVAMMLPLLVIGLKLPLWMCAALAAAAFVVIGLVLRPEAHTVEIELGQLSDTRAQTANSLIGDADVALNRLRKVAPLIRDAQMGDELRKLIATTDSILADVRNEPDSVFAIRRLFTFYLPSAVSVCEGWQTLERHAEPAAERMQQTRDTMHALNQAFVKFAQDADAPDIQEMDTTLKLLKDSLRADLESAS